MSSPITEAENLARRILACEEAGQPSHARAGPRAIERLRVYLTRFVGIAGVAALMVRALALARKQAPWLEAVAVADDGALQGYDEAIRMRETETESREGAVALLAQLLRLLNVFIGENITRHMAKDIWSDSRLDDLTDGSQE